MKPTKWWQWALIVIALLIVYGALFGDEEKSRPTSTTSTAETAAAAPRRPFRATSAQVERLFNEALGAESGGKPRVISARCGHGSCYVKYRAKAIAFGGDEVLRDQKPIWKKLFRDRRFERGTLVPYTTLTSVGGKESNGPIARVTCDRAANREIDWDNVTADGIKQLCLFVPLVKL